jgi:hypothetical protein
MIDSINTLESEASRQRQIEQDKKDWRACGDKAQAKA